MVYSPSQNEMSDPSPSDKSGTISFSLACKCIAEFVGCTLFVFAGTSAWASSKEDFTTPALAHGLAIFILITSLGHISGGHFNPAVTLSVFLCGKISAISALSYVLCQFGGGFLGALLTRGILTSGEYEGIFGGAPHLDPKLHSWHHGLLAEIVATFFLVHTVLMTAIDDSKWHAALAIGVTVTVDIMSIGHITGGAMNPARAFGPCVMWQVFEMGGTKAGFWEYHFIYWLGPAVGAFLAAALYKVCYSREARLLQ